MQWMLMPLRRYAEFSGRSRRMEFWMWQLAKVLFYFVYFIIMAAVLGASILSMMHGGAMSAAPSGAAMAGMGVGVILYLLLFLISLAIIIPDIAVAVRRLHDTDRSGLWLFAVIGPYVLGYILTIAGAVAQSSAMAGIGGIVVLLGFVAALVLLVIFCLPGTPGANRYGPDPLMRDIGAVFS